MVYSELSLLLIILLLKNGNYFPRRKKGLNVAPQLIDGLFYGPINHYLWLKVNEAVTVMADSIAQYCKWSPIAYWYFYIL